MYDTVAGSATYERWNSRASSTSGINRMVGSLQVASSNYKQCVPVYRSESTVANFSCRIG